MSTPSDGVFAWQMQHGRIDAFLKPAFGNLGELRLESHAKRKPSDSKMYLARMYQIDLTFVMAVWDEGPGSLHHSSRISGFPQTGRGAPRLTRRAAAPRITHGDRSLIAAK
jgi:hypothetical protein